jgi:two-component system response regulator FlrC
MSKEKILVLDNEHYIQWTIKTVLEGEKYSVLAFDSIKKVMPIFSESGVACLVTEYWIDHFCTLEVIRSLKQKFPEVYVMMLTSRDVSAKQYKEILNAGVDDFFGKPFPAEKILLHLRKGLKQRDILLQKKQLEQELDRIDPKRFINRVSSRAESVPL